MRAYASLTSAPVHQCTSAPVRQRWNKEHPRQETHAIPPVSCVPALPPCLDASLRIPTVMVPMSLMNSQEAR
jgi:hypothetical protein